MLFLKDRNRPRGMTDMHAQDQKTAEDVDFEEVTQEETVDQIEEPCKKKKEKTIYITGFTTRHTENYSVVGHKKALSIIKNIQVRKAFKDQYTVFGEHVGMRIRDLPSPHAKTIVKHIISTVLFEAEMGKYDNPNSFHPLIHSLLTVYPTFYSHNSHSLEYLNIPIFLVPLHLLNSLPFPVECR
ncbi:hypothetical protein NQ318_007373 [Aromia moschata]|uniref:Uncharacterized protein n=1 Tax=Aromia moschata TaxID=1265417 RepID=A0AAV8YFN8_9CUCU|nr:hypothetical protein NQ318_007373 [Aromia moschata]